MRYSLTSIVHQKCPQSAPRATHCASKDSNSVPAASGPEGELSSRLVEEEEEEEGQRNSSTRWNWS